MDEIKDLRMVEEVISQLLHIPWPGGAPHQNLDDDNDDVGEGLPDLQS